MLVDSHCHLDFAPEAERPEIIARAKRAGVKTLVTICTKIEEFPTVRAIAESDRDVWCSVGVHPHEAAKESNITAETLVGFARHPKVVGIGETGLDFYYEHSPRAEQEASFRAHIAAANEAGVPLIVHTRDADPETIGILEEERPQAGVIHCFSTGRMLAEHALKLGFYISLSGIVTFKITFQKSCPHPHRTQRVAYFVCYRCRHFSKYRHCSGLLHLFFKSFNF